MKLNQLRDRFLRNADFKAEYYRYDLAFEISDLVLKTRIMKGVTQAKLSELVGTKQSGIARLESGESLPSLSFLERIAKAFGAKLRIEFEFEEKLGKKFPQHISTTDYFEKGAFNSFPGQGGVWMLNQDSRSTQSNYFMEYLSC